jgi:hypothetical protein
VGQSEVLKLLTTSKIYWYPGSGNDLVPLLLMNSGSHCFGHELSNFSTDEKDRLLPWFTDLREVSSPAKFFGNCSPYSELWKKFESSFKVISSERLELDFNGCSSSNYLVTVELSRKGILQRIKFLYTQGDALKLFNNYIVSNNLDLTWVALIKFGAMSETIGRLPMLFARLQKQYGLDHPCMPEIFVSDRDWSKKTLPSYERLGSRDELWGNPTQHRVRGGGIHEWGYRTAAIWAKSSLYEHYLSYLEV